jgi:hypothetical protein
LTRERAFRHRRGALLTAFASALLRRVGDAIPWVLPWLIRGFPRVVADRVSGHDGAEREIYLQTGGLAAAM